MGSIMGSVPMQFNELGAHGSHAELISAALDGESLEGQGAGADRGSITALGEFLASLDEEGRTRWTDYHVVGDALRSWRGLPIAWKASRT